MSSAADDYEQRSARLRQRTDGPGRGWIIVFLTLGLLWCVFVAVTPGTPRLGTVVILGPFVVGFGLADGVHRHRRRAAARSGGFGSSSNTYVGHLAAVPRFAGLVAGAAGPEGDAAPVGGRVLIDDEGVRWSPGPYSRHRRHVPVLFAPWSAIADIEVRDIEGIGDPGIVEIQFDDGSKWAKAVQGREDLLDFLADRSGSV